MRSYLRFIVSISPLFLLVVCSGCITNYYEKFYVGEGRVSENAAKPSALSSQKEKLPLSGPEQPLRLCYSLAREQSDIEAEFLDTIESGYEFLGSSQFVATHCPWSCVIDHAKKIGATLVVLREKFSDKELRTGVMVMPSTSYSQGTWNTYSSGVISSPQTGMYSFQGNTYGRYSGTTTSYNAIPYSYAVNVYNQSALFFKRCSFDKDFYGALINLPVFLPGDRESDSVELKVFAVLRNSQAWKDGVRRGDIIECINGIPIKQRGDVRRFSETGKPITQITIRAEKK